MSSLQRTKHSALCPDYFVLLWVCSCCVNVGPGSGWNMPSAALLHDFSRLPRVVSVGSKTLSFVGLLLWNPHRLAASCGERSSQQWRDVISSVPGSFREEHKRLFIFSPFFLFCRLSEHRRPVCERQLWLVGSDPGSALAQWKHRPLWRRPRENHHLWLRSWCCLREPSHPVPPLRG